MPIAVSRTTVRRVGFELLAVVAWPAQLAASIVLPLLPVVAAVVADLERERAHRSGEDITPYHRAAGSWGAWVRARVLDRGVWLHDVPIALGSLLLGAASFFGFFLGVIGGLVLVAAPVLWSISGIGVSAGPWTVSSAPEAWLAVPVGAALLVLTAWALVVVSRCRDVVVRVLGGDERARLERELGVIRSSRASILEAFEAERRRIERDLHDGAQQDLVALTITLGLLEHQVGLTQSPEGARVGELARRAHDQADRALVRLRETVHGIHPRELTDHGLAAAVGEIARRSPLEVDVVATGRDASLPSPVAGALYFVVAEALTNVVRHAGVEAARVRVDVTGERAGVEICDAGCGGAELGDEPGQGSGLRGLRERVRGLGGELGVHSVPGAGTTVTATIPLRRDW